MRKFLITVFIISSVSLLYIFQQTKLLEHSYLMNSYNKSLSLLVDQNKQLRYNVVKLEAPARLENVILAKRNTDISMPRVWHKIKLEGADGAEKTVVGINPFVNTGKILLSIFSLDTEAVAKELSE